MSEQPIKLYNYKVFVMVDELNSKKLALDFIKRILDAKIT